MAAEGPKHSMIPSPLDRNTATHEVDTHKGAPFGTAYHSPGLRLTRVYEQCRSSTENHFAYSKLPPTTVELIASLPSLQLPFKNYQSPFYSNEEDIPEKPREFAGLLYRLKGGKGISSLGEFITVREDQVGQTSCTQPQFVTQPGWEYAALPPSRKLVKRWLEREKRPQKQTFRKAFPSQVRPRIFCVTSQFPTFCVFLQIEGPTQFNIYGFKNTPLKHAISTSRGRQNMTIMSLEVMGTVSPFKLLSSKIPITTHSTCP